VFGRSASAPFTPTHVRDRALAAWAAAAVGAFLRSESVDLKPIGLHELRHSYVSLMHDAGFSPERLGDYVGHSSAYMTDAYRHLIKGTRPIPRSGSSPTLPERPRREEARSGERAGMSPDLSPSPQTLQTPHRGAKRQLVRPGSE
jgi:hypothetical protein